MFTRSDSGATQGCKCQCHCCREPKWACSLCGRAFTRKFNALRHLDAKHEGSGATIPYGEYRNGDSPNKIADVVARVIRPKAIQGVSTKTRQMLDLIDKRAKEQVDQVLAARVKNPDKNIIISSKICKSCLSIELDGYLYTNRENETALPLHSCSCAWRFDYPSIDKNRELVETYLSEKTGIWLSEILSSFQSNSNHILIRFKKQNDLELVRLGYFISKMRNQREVNEVSRLIFHYISNELKNLELEIVDDFRSKYLPANDWRFGWLSHINGDSGVIAVSRLEGLQFLQFFKTNYSKIALKISGVQSYYKLLIL